MATLGLVDPKDWMSRTTLTFARGRSVTLKKADAAYKKYHATRSEVNRQALHSALEDYLIEKGQGRNWGKNRRNVQSGGLMAYIHEKTRDSALPQNVLTARIPEARQGVLYLWTNAKVSTQWAKIALEGALSIGEAHEWAALPKHTQSDVSKLSKAGALIAPKGKAKANAPMHREKHAPVIQLSAIGDDASAIQLAQHVFGSAFNKVYDTIRRVVMGMLRDIEMKYRSGALMGSIGGQIKNLINQILKKVAETAAPFVSDGLDIASGICSAIIAAKDRITVHQQRSKFVIMPGHPAQIGRAIETQMNWAIAKGAYKAAKGGAKLAINIATSGAATLVDVIAAAVEFAYKFISRLLEGFLMQDWIKVVQKHTQSMAWKKDENGVKRPAVVFEPDAFNALFELGCEASPCVPIMTLNSGISGDQMMFMKIFDDTGGILGQGSGISSLGNRPSASAQAEFNAGTQYWTALKQWGRDYLAATGFTFASSDPLAQGLFHHAINNHKPASMSLVDKALNLAAG